MFNFPFCENFSLPIINLWNFSLIILHFDCWDVLDFLVKYVLMWRKCYSMCQIELHREEQFYFFRSTFYETYFIISFFSPLLKHACCSFICSIEIMTRNVFRENICVVSDTTENVELLKRVFQYFSTQQNYELERSYNWYLHGLQVAVLLLLWWSWVPPWSQ